MRFAISRRLRPFLFVSTLVAVFGGAAAAHAAPFAYLSNFSANTVTVFDTATDTVVDTIPAVSSPMGVAIPAGSSDAYLLPACGAAPPCVGLVHVLDTSTNTVTSTIPVGTVAVSIALHPFAPRLYVVNNASNDVSVIDTTSQTVVATVPSLGVFPSGIAVESTGTKAYVASSGGQILSVLDTASNTTPTFVALDDSPFAVAAHPSTNRVYATYGCTTVSDNVAVIDTATDTIVTTIPVGACPRGITVNPSGTRVYVANWGNNTGTTVSVINTATNTVVDTLAVGDGPWAMAVHPDGSKLYVVNNGFNGPGSLSIVDLTGGGGGSSLVTGISTMARGPIMADFVVPPGCGDGSIVPPESCDDGNLVNGDGCDRNCTPTGCGNGIASAGEECDDGNLLDGDECTASCQVTGCGDGRMTLGEECDDGNHANGDGCSASCRHEFIPGGGKASTDCWLEWIVTNPTTTPLFDKRGRHPQKQTCRDGDPACDGDGTVNGSCTFRVRACVNASDALLPTCTPKSLTQVTVQQPSEAQAARAADAAVVRTQLGILASLLAEPPDTCSDTIEMVVPLRVTSSGPHEGKRPLRTKVSAPDKSGDTDGLKLVCRP